MLAYRENRAHPSPNSTWKITGLIMVGCVLMFAVLQGGLTYLYGQIDGTLSALLVSGIMLLLAFVLERLFFGRTFRQAWQALGLGVPNPRALLAATLVSLVAFAFFPLFSLITGAPMQLRSDWLWILLGIVALNGIAEETLFRGYGFGHLRREWSFHKAALISLLIFAAAHLFLFVQNSFAVAFAGTLVAVASAYPLAWLFERCNFTIWAGVIIHIMTHAIRLVDVPEPFYMPAVLAWIVLQIGIPFLIFLFRGSVLKAQPLNQPLFSTLDG